MPDAVQLTDLNVITRYSIAVRSATADRAELIETLREDLSWLERDQIRFRPAHPADAELEPEPAAEPDPTVEPEPPAKTAVAKKPVAKKAPAKKTATKRAAAKPAAKKPAGRR